MRSAWSPARSMSLETLFDVFANCMLACPTDFATAFGSIASACGTRMPSTLRRREWPLSAMPPAMPAAAAPSATAGPRALIAALFSASVTPPFATRPFAGLAVLALLDRAELRELLALFERAALRPDGAGFFAVRAEFGDAVLRAGLAFARPPAGLAPDVVRLARFEGPVVGLLAAIWIPHIARRRMATSYPISRPMMLGHACLARPNPGYRGHVRQRPPSMHARGGSWHGRDADP